MAFGHSFQYFSHKSFVKFSRKGERGPSLNPHMVVGILHSSAR